MMHFGPHSRPIEWVFTSPGPAVRPGVLGGALDARHAGSAHVLRLCDRHRMYYWAKGADGKGRICAAESPLERPNDWRFVGSVLAAQPGTDYNCGGPSFPFVVPRSDGPWLMYFGAWGRQRAEGKLPNTTGLALSDDEGLTWRYWGNWPVLACDRPWDCEGTGSVCVVRAGNEFRMYYTGLGAYMRRPDGVRTRHGDVIPHIGVGYAVSGDGVVWTKPLDGLMVGPRGLDADPYEYIVSKPFVIREGEGWRMWVSTCGIAYRVRSLVSDDGIEWRWVPSGPDGDFGIGARGAFDDEQRCYACVVRGADEYRCWYTGNGYGATGMGYAVGARLK